MSITGSQPVAVTGLAAASATDAPFTVTATIEPAPGYEVHLVVTVDGESLRLRLNHDWVALRRQQGYTIEAEAERLLLRHAGYQPTGTWTQDERGHLAATVAEIAGRCTTCVHGCECETGSAGCGHYGCGSVAAEITCDFARLAKAAAFPARRRATRTGR